MCKFMRKFVMLSFVAKKYPTLYMCFFALAFTISEILTFTIFYFQKVDQCHEVHFSQCHHLMAHATIYQSLQHIFSALAHTA